METSRVAVRSIAPGQSNIIVVPALTAREAPWRVALSFSGDDWRLKLAMKPPWVQDMVKSFLPLKQKAYMPRLEEAFSEWLGPEGVTTARRRTWSPPELYTNPPSSLWESPFLKRSLTQTNLNW